MNIFYLDNDPVLCAKYHCDKHVVKMILETAQLLCSAHHLLGTPTDVMYRLTHQNHPSAIWVRACALHYKWTYALFVALSQEYTHRYGRTHLSYTKLAEDLRVCPVPACSDDVFYPPPAVMPEVYQNKDVITAYRHYYQDGKTNLLRYTNRDVPDWLNKSQIQSL